MSEEKNILEELNEEETCGCGGNCACSEEAGTESGNACCGGGCGV